MVLAHRYSYYSLYGYRAAAVMQYIQNMCLFRGETVLSKLFLAGTCDYKRGMVEYSPQTKIYIVVPAWPVIVNIQLAFIEGNAGFPLIL